MNFAERFRGDAGGTVPQPSPDVAEKIVQTSKKVAAAAAPLAFVACQALGGVVPSDGGPETTTTTTIDPSNPDIHTSINLVEYNYSNQAPEAAYSVSVVGDSITHITAGDVHTTLDPVYRVRVSGRWGETIAGQQISINRYANESNIAVINLGTNDFWSYTEMPKAKADYINAVMGFAGSACVAFVSLTEVGTQEPTADGRIYRQADAASFNDFLELEANATDNVYIDWASHIAADPGVDGIHPTTPEAKADYAQTIKAGVDACAAKLDARAAQ